MLKKTRQPVLESKADGQRKKRRPLRYVRSGSSITRWAAGLDSVGVVTVSAAILMGRASVLGVLWPFGASFYTSVVTTLPQHAVAAGIALVAGAATTRVLGRTVVTALNVLLLNAVLKSLEKPARPASVQKKALFTGALVLVSLSVWGAMTSAAPYTYLMAGVEAVATVGLTLAFTYAVPLMRGPVRRFSQEELASLCILVASAAAGVSEIRIGPVELRNVVGTFITLSMALAGGAGVGAAAGASVGVVTALSRPMIVTLVGTQALGGLVAGLFRGTGKVGAVIGFLLGAMALTLPVDSSAGVTKTVFEILAAAALFLVVRLPDRAMRLFARAEDAVLPRAGPRLQEVVASRLHEFARVLRELSKSYAHIAATTAVDKDVSVYFDRIVRRVCESCDRYAACWDGALCRRHKAMAELLNVVETDASATLSRVPADLRENCPRAPDLLAAMMCISELLKTQRVWVSRAGEMKNVLAEQLKGVATVVDGLAGEVRVMPVLSLGKKREIDYEISIARRAKLGSIICGDSILHKELKGNKLVLILSDGMGSGPSAALESKATVALLEQLVDNGFDPDLAVQTVNSFMKLKFPDETFATVDMAIVDLATGDAEFVKRSAAPSFIKREGEVTVLTASSLPIGILGQAEADRSHKIVKNGDVLVMVTDGAMQWVRASKKDEPFANFLTRLKMQHADEISGRLLDKVLEAGSEASADDVTILVVRFLAAVQEKTQ
jgi:stage II sporulation protein E